MGKVKEIQILASRAKNTDRGPASPAEALIRALQSGATIADVTNRETGEVMVRLCNSKGISFHVRLKSGLGELKPDQLEIYAKARQGKSVQGLGSPRINEERDAWLRATVAMYWANGHPLKGSAGKASAFDLTAKEAAEAEITNAKGKPLTAERIQRIWEESSVKPELKNAVKGNPD